jgi:Flp pilus assembly pilin Flp
MNGPFRHRLADSFLCFWEDETGVISVGQALLMLTVVVIGMIAGLATVRDQLVQEFGDMAVALESLDQSYSMTINGVTTEFIDSTTLADPADDEPACIDIEEPATAGE